MRTTELSLILKYERAVVQISVETLKNIMDLISKVVLNSKRLKPVKLRYAPSTICRHESTQTFLTFPYGLGFSSFKQSPDVVLTNNQISFLKKSISVSYFMQENERLIYI